MQHQGRIAEDRTGRRAPEATDAGSLAVARRAIRAVRPDLRGERLRVYENGWDCLAVGAGDRVFKFPRTDAARERLRGEPVRLDFARRHLAGSTLTDMPALPEMTLHEVPTLFSEHRLIAGETVDPAVYHAMDGAARERLAGRLATLYVALHAADPAEAQAAGIGRVSRWPSADHLFTGVRDCLDPPLLARVAELLGRVSVSEADALVFGHFDTHGWNLACDPVTGRVSGVFDFGDAGLGPRHTDLSYPSFVSPDLTARVVRCYQERGGRPVDLARIFDLHGVLRVVELADAGTDRAPYVWAVTDWFAALDRWKADAAVEGS